MDELKAGVELALHSKDAARARRRTLDSNSCLEADSVGAPAPSPVPRGCDIRNVFEARHSFRRRQARKILFELLGPCGAGDSSSAGEGSHAGRGFGIQLGRRGEGDSRRCPHFVPIRHLESLPLSRTGLRRPRQSGPAASFWLWDRRGGGGEGGAHESAQELAAHGSVRWSWAEGGMARAAAERRRAAWVGGRRLLSTVRLMDSNDSIHGSRVAAEGSIQQGDPPAPARTASAWSVPPAPPSMTSDQPHRGGRPIGRDRTVCITGRAAIQNA